MGVLSSRLPPTHLIFHSSSPSSLFQPTLHLSLLLCLLFFLPMFREGYFIASVWCALGASAFTSVHLTSSVDSRRAQTTHALQLSQSNSNEDESSLHRRSFLSNAISVAGLFTLMPQSSYATVIDVNTPSVGTLKSISKEEAEQRFRAGRGSLEYLITHYDEICEGGGDNVRRYLGTVGTTSGLFGIGKAMKVLGEDVDDIVECELRLLWIMCLCICYLSTLSYTVACSTSLTLLGNIQQQYKRYGTCNRN